MNKLHLDTRMKLMGLDNVSYPLETNFVYEVPNYIYNYEGLNVVCSLVNSTTMSYTLSDSFNSLITAKNLSMDTVVKKIESLLWGLSTIKPVEVLNNKTDSLSRAYLIKEGLFVR